MSKRKSRSRHATRGRASATYREGLREANRILHEHYTLPDQDSWQEIALETWTPAGTPDREAFNHYITKYADQLGIAWANAVLKLDIFLQAKDSACVVEHYDRAFQRYPRCALIEIWVTDHIFYHLGDFWRAREMYVYQADTLPTHPKPRYELGFLHHIIGDHEESLRWFNEAVPLLEGQEHNFQAQVYFNRGLIRYMLHSHDKHALADIRQALKLRPDYAEAQQVLKAIKLDRRRGDL